MKLALTFFIAIALAIGSFIFIPAGSSGQPNSENNMKVLIIGTDSAGTAALAHFASIDVPATIVETEKEASAIINAELSTAANMKPPVLPATAKLSTNQLKTETERTVSNHTKRTFYDLPPNDFGFSGQSYANPIRAQPFV